MPLGSTMESHLRASDDVVLVFLVKFNEITAPAPDTYDEIAVFFGMCLCIQKRIAVDGIELKLMSASASEIGDKLSELFFGIG